MGWNNGGDNHLMTDDLGKVPWQPRMMYSAKQLRNISCQWLTGRGLDSAVL